MGRQAFSAQRAEGIVDGGRQRQWRPRYPATVPPKLLRRLCHRCRRTQSRGCVSCSRGVRVSSIRSVSPSLAVVHVDDVGSQRGRRDRLPQELASKVEKCAAFKRLNITSGNELLVPHRRQNLPL